MQQKWISGLATGIVVLASLSLFGWSVKQVSTGKSTWPTWIQAPLQSFVGFLDLFEAAKQEVSEYPKTFVRTPEDFVPINTLEEDVTILTSYHNE